MSTSRRTTRPSWFVSSSAVLAVLVFALLAAVPRVEASALTTTINANERTCFYALVDKVGEKVRIHTLERARDPNRSPRRVGRETDPPPSLSLSDVPTKVGFYFAVSFLPSCWREANVFVLNVESTRTRCNREVRSTLTGS